MAKIKFNLNFGGETIRTLADLRENFSIEDVLDNYRNGTLARWLDSRNYADELEQVKAITATDARGILAELIRIFGVASDPAEIEADLSLVDYLEGRRKFWADIKAGNLDTATQRGSEKVIREYLEGYDALVQDVIAHKDDLHYIYDRLDEIAAKYPNMLEISASSLFCRFYDEAPLAALALLGDSSTRPYYALDDKELSISIGNDGRVYFSIRQR